MEAISWASLEWLDDKTPFSPRFQDVYYSRAGAVEEYRHVFLQGSDLPARWSGLESFSIGELGFGTGLGFLTTLKTFLDARPSLGLHSRLHFLSFEAHPICPADLERIHHPFPEFREWSRLLLDQYPHRVEGIHRLQFPGTTLTLVFGDAQTWARKLVLPAEAPGINAWFLHGFAPQKNPGLWDRSLFEDLVALSAPKATAATFSVANQVQESLRSAGFFVEKRPGFSEKKERLYAELRSDPVRPRMASIGLDVISTPRTSKSRPNVAIIGGGFAGTSIARSLSFRGSLITLFESQDALATQASGNPTGLFMPFLATEPDPKCRIALQASLYFEREYRKENSNSSPSGVLNLCENHPEKERLLRAVERMNLPPEVARACSSDEAQSSSGLGKSLQAPEGGVLLPAAGFLSPKIWCSQQWGRAESAGANLKLKTRVESLQRLGDRWALFGENNQCLGEFDWVFIANAQDARRLVGYCELPLIPVRGQIALIENHPILSRTQLPLAWENSLAPPLGGVQSLGATYDRKSESLEVRPTENESLWNSLLRWIPELGTPPPLTGRTSLRLYAPDGIATIGPGVDSELYSSLFKDLAKGFPPSRYANTEVLPGLFLSVGHGSRGLMTSALGGELLASLAYGEVLPLERELVESLHPARFILRKLKKSKT